MKTPITSINKDNIITIMPEHKWCLNITDLKTKKKIQTTIPPTDGDRIDIITDDKMIEGYNYGIDCIIIEIRDGEPKRIIS